MGTHRQIAGTPQVELPLNVSVDDAMLEWIELSEECLDASKIQAYRERYEMLLAHAEQGAPIRAISYRLERGEDEVVLPPEAKQVIVAAGKPARTGLPKVRLDEAPAKKAPVRIYTSRREDAGKSALVEAATAAVAPVEKAREPRKQLRHGPIPRPLDHERAKALGQRARQAREAAGWAGFGAGPIFCERAGFSRQGLRNLECGLARTPDVLERFIRFLRVSKEWLEHGTGVMFPRPDEVPEAPLWHHPSCGVPGGGRKPVGSQAKPVTAVRVIAPAAPSLPLSTVAPSPVPPSDAQRLAAVADTLSEMGRTVEALGQALVGLGKTLACLVESTTREVKL